MIAQILPKNYPQVNTRSEIANAAGPGTQLEHELFRAESLLSLITTSAGAAALAEVDADQRQAVLNAIIEMVSAARNTASAIEVLAD